VSVRDDSSPHRRTDLDPLLWAIAAAIAGAIVYLAYSL
jgi:hypothetical protein